MIEAVKGFGNTCLAKCRCDECAAEASFKALHDDASGRFKTAASRALKLAQPGMVNKRLGDMGWIVTNGRLRCRKCEAKRKASKQKEAPMPEQNITPLRQPTREQKRQITELLNTAYDLKAERYIGTETDMTVAEAVGGGCMFGWVAEIREAMFGPDGGNEAIDRLVAEIQQWRETAEKLATDMHATLRDFNDARAKVADMQTKLTAIAKAVGPKGRAI